MLSKSPKLPLPTISVIAQRWLDEWRGSIRRAGMPLLVSDVLQPIARTGNKSTESRGPTSGDGDRCRRYEQRRLTDQAPLSRGGFRFGWRGWQPLFPLMLARPALVLRLDRCLNALFRVRGDVPSRPEEILLAPAFGTHAVQVSGHPIHAEALRARGFHSADVSALSRAGLSEASVSGIRSFSTPVIPGNGGKNVDGGTGGVTMCELLEFLLGVVGGAMRCQRASLTKGFTISDPTHEIGKNTVDSLHNSEVFRRKSLQDKQ